jgi:hypothetical protein
VVDHDRESCPDCWHPIRGTAAYTVESAGVFGDVSAALVNTGPGEGAASEGKVVLVLLNGDLQMTMWLTPDAALNLAGGIAAAARTIKYSSVESLDRDSRA